MSICTALLMFLTICIPEICRAFQRPCGQCNPQFFLLSFLVSLLFAPAVLHCFREITALKLQHLPVIAFNSLRE